MRKNQSYSYNMSNHINLTKEETELLNVFIEEYNDMFQEILHHTEKPFLDKIMNNVRIKLGDKADNFTKLTYMKLTTLIKSEHYLKDIKGTAKIREMLKSFGKEDALGILPPLALDQFIPHCRKTAKAYHLCGCEFSRPQATHVDYVICLKCRHIYKPDNVHLYCDECEVDYYSAVFNEEEEREKEREERETRKKSRIEEDEEREIDDEEREDYKLATWEKYHCVGYIHDKMKCNECRKFLYYSQKKNMLKCFHCGLESKPEKMSWRCYICKGQFSCNAKVFNPIIFKTMKLAIKDSLFQNQPARPMKIPCCKIDIDTNTFRHKKECDGILLECYLDNEAVLLCKKCTSMSQCANNIWLCPQCGRGFKSERKPNPHMKRIIKVHIEAYPEVNINGCHEALNSTGNMLPYNQGNGKSYRESPQSYSRRENNLMPTQFINESNAQSSKNIRHVKTLNKEGMHSDYINDNMSSTSTTMSMFSRNGHGNSKNDNNNKQLMENKPTYKKLMQINDFECQDNEIELNIRKMPTMKNKQPGRALPSFTPELLNNSKYQFNLNVNVKPKEPPATARVAKKKMVIIEPGEDFNPEDFTIGAQIGEGTFGKIYSATYDKSDGEYAMKKIVLYSEAAINEIKEEYDLIIKIMKSNSRITLNIIKIFGTKVLKIDKTTFEFYVVLEKATSDWEKEIMKRAETKSFYTQGELIQILKELVKTFAVLQRNKITHRDIKPQNILKVDETYKICDFGEATMSMEKEKHLQTIRGTELYMSPILFHGLKQKSTVANHNCFKSDVFSLGLCVLLAASLTFHALYDVRELTDTESISIVLTKYLITRYNNEFISVLGKMLEFDEAKRYDFIELEEVIRGF